MHRHLWNHGNVSEYSLSVAYRMSDLPILCTAVVQLF